MRFDSLCQQLFMYCKTLRLGVGSVSHLSKGENGHGVKLSGGEVKNWFPAHVFMP
jgi:hypothetical protein